MPLVVAGGAVRGDWGARGQDGHATAGGTPALPYQGENFWML